MAIQFINANTAFVETGVTTITLTKPTNTADGDVMITSFGLRPNTATITTLAGWTLIRDTPNANTTQNRLASYYKVAANEGASYVWTLATAPAGCVGGIITLRGVKGTTPATSINIDNGLAQSVASANVPTPDVTTTVRDTFLVVTACVSNNNTFTAPAAIGGDKAMDERVDNKCTTAQMMLGMFTCEHVAASATGQKTAVDSLTPQVADVGTAQIMAFMPLLPVATIRAVRVTSRNVGPRALRFRFRQPYVPVVTFVAVAAAAPDFFDDTGNLASFFDDKVDDEQIESMYSQPVVADGEPTVYDVPFDLIDQTGDDFVVDLAQATWPVEAQAPPSPAQDQWFWDDDSSSITVSAGYQNLTVEPDCYQEYWFDDIGIEAEVFDESAPVLADAPTAGSPFEDPAFDDFADEDVLLDSAPVVAEIETTRADPWEWNDGDEASAIYAGYQTSEGLRERFDEEWETETFSEEHIEDSAPVGPDAPSEGSRFDEAWQGEWESDFDEVLESQPVGADGEPNTYNVDPLWEDETQLDVTFDDAPVGADAPSEAALFDDPWQWESDLDEWVEESEPVGADGEPNVYEVDPLWWEDEAQDAAFDDGPVGADAPSEGLAGDDWIFEELDAETPIEDSAPVGANGEPNVYDVDWFWWDDTHDEVTEAASDSAPVSTAPPAAENQALVDDWDWSDVGLEHDIFDESPPVGEDAPLIPVVAPKPFGRPGKYKTKPPKPKPVAPPLKAPPVEPEPLPSITTVEAVVGFELEITAEVSVELVTHSVTSFGVAADALSSLEADHLGEPATLALADADARSSSELAPPAEGSSLGLAEEGQAYGDLWLERPITIEEAERILRKLKT